MLHVIVYKSNSGGGRYVFPVPIKKILQLKEAHRFLEVCLSILVPCSQLPSSEIQIQDVHLLSSHLTMCITKSVSAAY